MRRFRFHLGTLVILVLLLGVAFAALRESNDTWDSGIFSITLGMLLISILLAFHRTEKRQAFWLGFALFGWIYLGLSLAPSIQSRLITTKGLAYLDSKVVRPISRSEALYDLLVENDSQAIALVVNKGNGELDQHAYDPWIEAVVPELPGGTIADGIKRHHRELHSNWSLAPRHRRRTLGRSAFQIPPHNELTTDFRTGSGASLDLE